MSPALQFCYLSSGPIVLFAATSNHLIVLKCVAGFLPSTPLFSLTVSPGKFSLWLSPLSPGEMHLSSNNKEFFLSTFCVPPFLMPSGLG